MLIGTAVISLSEKVGGSRTQNGSVEPLERSGHQRTRIRHQPLDLRTRVCHEENFRRRQVDPKLRIYDFLAAYWPSHSGVSTGSSEFRR